MTIYKSAQTFAAENIDLLNKQLGRIKREHELNLYISSLSRIHEDIASNPDKNLESIIEDSVQPFFRKNVKDLIDGIGEFNFYTNPISSISDFLKASWLDLNQEQEPLKPAAPQIDTLKAEDVDANTIISWTPRERTEFLKNLAYPSKFRREVDVILGNLGLYEDLLQKARLGKVREAKKMYIEDVIEPLLNFSMGEGESIFEEPQGTEVPQAELEPELEAEPEVSEVGLESEKSEVPEKDLGPQELDLEEEDEEDLTPPAPISDAEKIASSKLTEEEAMNSYVFDSPEMKEFLSRGASPYIDFSSTPPKLNKDMDSVLDKFLDLMDKINSTISSKQDYRSENKSKINDFMYSVKLAELKTEDSISEYEKYATEEQTSLFRSIKDEYYRNRPSTKIIMAVEDSLSVNPLNSKIFSSIYHSSATGAYILLSEIPEKKAFQGVDPYDRVNQEQLPEVQRQMIEDAGKRLLNGTKNFFDILNRDASKNYTYQVSINKNMLFRNAANTVINNGEIYRTSPCPVCFKEIPYSYKMSKFRGMEGVNYLSDFYCPIFSPFKSEPNESGERVAVTEEDFYSKKSWSINQEGFLNLYSGERELRKLKLYTNAVSWDKIKNMLSSSDPSKHEEGWHRRASMLYELGCELLTTEAVRIGSDHFNCPFDTKGYQEDRGSFCGLSISPAQNFSQDLSPRLAVQPEWNGQPSEWFAGAEGQYSNKDSLSGGEWPSEEFLNAAKKLQSGGFKFSKLTFACTCHIDELGTYSSRQYSTLALSKVGPAGSPGFIYPTDRFGNKKELERGTMSFLVCAIPTSISSFTRDPEKDGFILDYMKNLKVNSPSDYVNFLELMARKGVDVQDVMDLHNDTIRYASKESKQSFSQELSKNSGMKKRIKKLEEIIKTSILSIPDEEQIKLLRGMNLTCPFGHNFNIGYSLDFGKAYAGVYARPTIEAKEKKKGIINQYRDVITSSGEENIESLIQRGIIVPAEKYNYMHEQLYFEDWVNVPEENRIVAPDYKNPEKKLLKFSIGLTTEGNPIDYIYVRDNMFGVKKIRNEIWNPSGSYSYPMKRINVFTETRPKEYSRDKSGENDSSSGEIGGVTENERDEFIDAVKAPSSPIPGTEPYPENLALYSQKYKDLLDMKIRSLSRTLSSCLRIIDTWTRASISNTVIQSFFSPYVVNQKDMAGYVPSIIRSIESYLDIEDFEDPDLEIPKPTKNKINGMSAFFIIRNVVKVYEELYSNIRSKIHLMEDKNFADQVAEIVIEKSLELAESEFYSYFLDAQKTGLKRSFEVSFKDDSLNVIAKNIVSKNEGLRKFVTLNDDNFTATERNTFHKSGRLILISYAKFLANKLSVIHKQFLDKNAPLYIGYPIGIDLSNPDRIIGFKSGDKWVGGINSGQAENIVQNLSEAIEESNGQILQSVNGLNYAQRIDRFWEELNKAITEAKTNITSGKLLYDSKEYLSERISYLTGQEIDSVRKIVNSTLPSRMIFLASTPENPETSTSLFTKRRIPFVSKKLPFAAKIQRVDQWSVHSKLGEGNYMFNSKEEAEEYLKTKLNNSENYEVVFEPYYIDEDSNFNSSRLQVGIVSPRKTGDDVWPPPREDNRWEFAGIILPFEDPGFSANKSMAKASGLNVASYKLVINFDGKPLDISILIRRGRDDSQIKRLIVLESSILEEKKNMIRLINQYKMKEAKEIKEDPKLLEKFIQKVYVDYKDNIRKIYAEIERIPIKLGSKACYTGPEAKDAKHLKASDNSSFAPKSMLTMLIENPITAYNIINNPEVRGADITTEDQRRLTQFIIRLYDLDYLAEEIRKIGPRYASITAQNILDGEPIPSEFNISKFLSNSSLVWKSNSGEERVGWASKPSEYFDVVPGTKKSKRGSHFMYTFGVGGQKREVAGGITGYPDAKELVRAGIAPDDALGSIISGENNIVDKVEQDMLEYITSRTSGERKNPAKDKLAQSKQFNKISLRRIELDRIILSLGIFDFSDVDMPKF